MRNYLNLMIRDQSKREPPRAEANRFYLYDVISPWNDCAKKLKDFLNDQEEGTDVHIHINSPGGDCFEGRTMASLIRTYSGKVICHIDGVAASAASTVAVVCDEVHMSIGTQIMIHNAWCFTAGNKKELQDTIGLLQDIDQNIRKDYAMKTGLDESEIEEMMDAETWMNADKAIEKGFADVIDEGKKAKDTSNFVLDCYDNVPDELKNRPSDEDDTKEIIEANMRRLRLFEFA